jgi:multidrug efflux pump subunit AcrA (membrane-fusion protein)
MKQKLFIHTSALRRASFVTLMLGILLTAACSAGSPAAPATPEVIPTVIADSTIITEGRLEPVRFAEIAFKSSGVVSDVPVAEGEVVTKGQTLLIIGGESDKSYAAAQLELADAQKALNDLINSSEIDFAQVIIDLNEAEEEYDEAVQYLNYLKTSPKVPRTETYLYYLRRQEGYAYRTRTKFFKGPAPEGWIIETQDDVNLKKAKVDELQKTYDRMKDSGIDSDQLAVLEAQMNTAKARLAAFSVTAPFDGVVASLNAKVGNSVNTGDVAVTIADFSNWVVKTTDLTEIDVVNLEEDQPVVVTLDALPDMELKGNILSIGQTYSENQGDVVYEATILLTDIDPAMRWGMTAAVKFENEE